MDALAGKRIIILGLARQGSALARFAAEAGAMVTISDLKPVGQLAQEMERLADLEITYVLGEHPLVMLENADVLAVSGSVPADAPIVEAARRKGMAITNDSLEFIRRAPSAVIGITGSAGKTTTTALTGAMGQSAGRQTWVGGNIGRPLISDLHKMRPEDMVVQELSSFQLELWTQSPTVAAVLNITPNHLDRHKTMSSYINAKANILLHQSQKDVALLSADDPGSSALKPLANGRLRLFSLVGEVDDGAFIRDGQIWLRNGHETAVCRLDRVRLRGRHNLSNILAAVTLADAVGVPPEAMGEAIANFHGVEHRLERVQTIDGVVYINDSIATAPERALAAIEAFNEPIILLAGGRDKDMAWEEWGRRVRQKVRHAILFGSLAGKLEAVLRQPELESVPGELEIRRVDTLEEAVITAAKVARPGDVVLMSPGGTSFDAFADFAERGAVFRQIVADLARRRIDAPGQRIKHG